MFIAGSLLLAPFHTGIAVSNLAVVATELWILAFWANRRGKNIASGLLLALSVGPKPQVGLCFLLYFLARRKWQPAIASVAGIMAIASVAIGRLNMAHVHWLANYELDNRALVSSGILGDFTERNPLRFGLVNLHVALYPFLRGREATDIAALVLGTALVVGCLLLIIRTQMKDDLLCLSALAVLSLLSVYHRFYDAAVLIIPLSWLMTRLSAAATIRVGVGLTMIAAFLLPGGTLLQTLQDKGVLSSTLKTNDWWKLPDHGPRRLGFADSCSYPSLRNLAQREAGDSTRESGRDAGTRNDHSGFKPLNPPDLRPRLKPAFSFRRESDRHD